MPNLLLIAGTGRNSGKTTLACHIIRKFSTRHKVIGIKIAPHMHVTDSGGLMVFDSSVMVVCQETRTDSSKDSSRMLEAGAEKAFFLAVSDDSLEEAFSILSKKLSEDELLVCESGGLRHHVKPGLFLMLNRKGNTQIKPSAEKLRPLADKWINFDNGHFDFDLSDIDIAGSSWQIRNNFNNRI